MHDKRIRHVLAMTLFTLLIVSPMTAGAGQACKGADGSQFINRFDQNGDGLVSAEEFTRGTEDRFARLDSNRDGYLDAEEAPKRASHHDRTLKKMAAECDTDGDGRVSRTEFSGPAAEFNRLDADADGFLTREEVRPGCRHSMKNCPLRTE